MRWPSRILKLPRATLRTLFGLLRQRAGMPRESEPPPAPLVPVMPPADSSTTPPPPKDPLEFDDFEGSGGATDPSDVPTLRESVRAKVVVPGPQPPRSPFPPPRKRGQA